MSNTLSAQFELLSSKLQQLDGSAAKEQDTDLRHDISDTGGRQNMTTRSGALGWFDIRTCTMLTSTPRFDISICCAILVMLLLLLNSR